MSGQGAPRAKTSPKQGPLRATMPLSSVTKEGSGLGSVSPPNWQDAFGRRSPGAPFTRGVSPKTVRSSTIRRTASLDAIYLRGLFPRDSVFWHRDRATQTDRSSSLDSLQMVISNEVVEDKLARLTTKQRRRSCSRDLNAEKGDLFPGYHIRNPPSPIAKSSNIPPKSSRSSEEGLNQEIEQYAVNLAESQCDRLREPIPEGRKAPVAELIREGPYSRTHQSTNQNSSEDSQGSSPDQDRMLSGSSPQINRFSARAPPDGCERVLSKSVPILRPIPREVVSHPNALFTLKPSSHSAFESLHKGMETVNQECEQNEADSSDRDSPKVPDQEDP